MCVLRDFTSFIACCFSGLWFSWSLVSTVKVWNARSSSSSVLSKQECQHLLLARVERHLTNTEMELLARRQPLLTQHWPALLAKQLSGTVARIKCWAQPAEGRRCQTQTRTDAATFTTIYWPTWRSLSLMARLVSRAPCMWDCVFVGVVCLILTYDRICHRAQPSLVFCSSCLIHAVACSSADDRAGSVWL